MFDVGFAELFLLSIVGLLILGPQRLPAVARTLGGFVRKARSSWFQMKRTIEAELAAAEAANPLKEAQQELKSASREIAELANQSIADPAGKPDSGPDKKNTEDSPDRAE